MSLFSWLFAKFRRPAITSALTPVPVNPVTPPTEAERQARQQQREADFLLGLAEQFGRDVEQERDLSNMLPTELLRAMSRLRHNQADQAIARQWGHVEEELRLVVEAQELEATAQHLLWQHCLCERFGLRIGTKLSQHQLEPGMTLDMVLAVFGSPAEGAITALPDGPGAYLFRYGSSDTGTLIEVRQEVVTWVRLGTVAFAHHLYDLPMVYGPDGLLNLPA